MKSRDLNDFGLDVFDVSKMVLSLCE